MSSTSTRCYYYYYCLYYSYLLSPSLPCIAQVTQVRPAARDSLVRAVESGEVVSPLLGRGQQLTAAVWS